MKRTTKRNNKTQRLLCTGLGLMLGFQALTLTPAISSAAVPPLPGPGNPILYDDFAGGGQYKQNWTNWYNQNGGSGTFARTTDGTRTVGKFTQTPASASSWAKFQPMNETFSVVGYRYLNLSLRSPGYEDALVRINLNDGTRNYDLTGGWTSVPETWTDMQFDLNELDPAIKKDKVKLEVWLRQSGGQYGEILMDDITVTTDSSGTAPTLTAVSMTANTEHAYNQNTMFTFQTTFTDADNEKPYAIQVVINDTAYDLKELDAADVTYTDGKAYSYAIKLPPGNHSYYFRTTDTTSNEVTTPIQSGLSVVQASQLIDVVVSQAGYNAGDFKGAKVVSSTPLTDLTYEIRNGGAVAATGSMTAEGQHWNRYVYSIDFTSLTVPGSSYTIKSNGITSYPFAISTNVWDGYKDEMTAFYRLLRAGVATEEAYPAGYSSVAPSAKLYHGAGHLDDAVSIDGTTHYDLTGGWYDAGDYGKYGGNQWVGAQIALAYLRYADSPSVQYDNDGNGIPDLIDEAIFGSEYLIKFADQLGGEMYNLKNNASFVHPEKSTDNIPGTADDRKLSDLSVGGSAKSAGTLAATARAIRTAIAGGDISAAAQGDLLAFANACEAAAVVFHEYVLDNPNGPIGSYSTRGGIANSMLLADVELYLLTNDVAYKNAAADKINALVFSDLASTNYWDMRPISMAEFYPVADAATQAHIQSLLKQQVDYFLSSTDDTPYGVLNQFKNFGVNEPHASYLGDMLRYYELFGDPAALHAVQKGMYWIFGVNPWNISWVSGIGTDHVDFLHTRFDELANTAGGTGIVLPGAMVSGPNIKDPKDKRSVSPWYADRSMHQDDVSQWRYNEFSISIQAGLLYTVMGLSAMGGTSSAGGSYPAELPIQAPVIGDVVRGSVTLFAQPDANTTGLEYAAGGGAYTPMTASGEAYTAVIDESAAAPYTNRRVDIRGVDALGHHTYSSTHYTVAPPLPDPSTPLLYDNFDGSGVWGGSAANTNWVNWYNQNGGTGAFAKLTENGRTIGKFSQTPTSASSAAKFQPWHDVVDLSGYRYLNFKVKNPGYSELRTRIEVSDGSRTYNLTGGWVTVPAEWTDLQFDLNALVPAINKKSLKLSVWLKQNVVGYGEMLMDDITASNTASGSAPVLSGASVDEASGNPLTPFTFNVTYTDADNEAPFAMELVLDGVIRQMIPVDMNDTSYADGKAYTYTTTLPAGVHSYYFHTTDTSSDAVSTAVMTGPTVAETQVPSLLQEDFDDGTADGWSATSGVWSVQNGQYSGTAASGTSYSVAGDSSWTDYTLEARVNVTNNTGGNKDAGLAFRYTDANNHYVLYVKNNDRTGRKLELVKVVNGVKTTLAHASPSVAADTFYTYRIVADGAELSVYQDDTLILSATDSAHASGGIAARVYASTKALFDDISVTAI